MRVLRAIQRHGLNDAVRAKFAMAIPVLDATLASLSADRAVSLFDHQSFNFFEQVIGYFGPPIRKTVVWILGGISDHLLFGQSKLAKAADRNQ